FSRTQSAAERPRIASTISALLLTVAASCKLTPSVPLRSPMRESGPCADMRRRMSGRPLDVRIGSRGASGPVSGPRRDTDRRTKMIYAINYDLKRPGQNYDELHKAIKNLGDWWHYLGSTWLVDTNLNAKGVW